MRLILFRHGIAFDRDDPACPPDPDRPLVPRGERRTRAAARGLRRAGIAPAAIWTSPYLRAAQTARIAAEEVGIPAGAVVTTPALLPDARPEELLQELGRAPLEEVLCAGHAPHLDELLARTLGMRGPSPFALKKAGAASVLWEPGTGGDLEWLLTPRLLRRLGR